MKPFKNIDEQIDLLRDKNFCILDKDIDQIKQALNSISYYRLMGYALKYKTTTDNGKSDYNNKNFLDIIKLYQYDAELRKLILHKVGQAEVKLRFIIAHTLGKISPSFHNDSQYWISKEKFDDWHRYVKRTISTSSSLSAKHYSNDLLNMEIWVVMDEITLGNLVSLFAGIQPEYQEKIMECLNIPSNSKFNNISHFSYLLIFIRKLRNTCCHFNRLFDKKFTIKPRHQSNIVKSLKILNNEMDIVLGKSIYNYDSYTKKILDVLKDIKNI